MRGAEPVRGGVEQCYCVSHFYRGCIIGRRTNTAGQDLPGQGKQGWLVTQHRRQRLEFRLCLPAGEQFKLLSTGIAQFDNGQDGFPFPGTLCVSLMSA